jgi:DNA-binding GntR family transcriptional regulator
VHESLFETLSVNYSLEITRVEQDLRAITADDEPVSLLRVEPGSPLLLIYLKFCTNCEHLSVYSSLLCNTAGYSIGTIL